VDWGLGVALLVALALSKGEREDISLANHHARCLELLLLCT
jgi:hypothetical protein